MKGFVNAIFRALCALVALLYGMKCFLKYADREIGTRVNFVPAAGARRFPALTLCWKLGYKKSVLKSYGFSKQSQVVDYGSFPPNLTLVGFMEESRFLLTEYLHAVVIRTFSKVWGNYENVLYRDNQVLAPGEDFLPTSSVPEANLSASLLRWTSSFSLKDKGLCYTADIPEDFVSAGVSGLSLRLYANPAYKMKAGVDFVDRGWTLFLHQKGQFHRSTTLAIGVKDSFETSALLSYSMFMKLRDSADCSRDMTEGFDACWMTNVNRRIKNKIGCLFPWNYNELHPEDESLLCKDRSDYVGKAEEEAAAEMLDTEVRGCQTPCDIMAFSLLASDEGGRVRNPATGKLVSEYGTLDLTFKEEVSTTKEYYVYDAISMVGEAGGYLGLFLGISCYQILMMMSEWAMAKYSFSGTAEAEKEEAGRH